MSTLPPLYDRWVGELLGQPVAPEPLSTCSDCAMCPGGGAHTRPSSRLVLDPALKCCTYWPTFPNYQVGALLDDPGPYAEDRRASLRARLGGGREVTPLGLGTPPERAGLDGALTATTGLHPEQRCPHLTQDPRGQAACSVWAHRDAVCSTWWCRYERAAAGLRFWWSLRFLLRSIETALALWCCLEEDLEPEVLQLNLGREGQPRGAWAGPEVTRAQLWGRLAGQEEAFYRRCAARVAGLGWAEVQRVCGPTVQALARHAAAQHARLDEPLPPRLSVGPHQVTGMGPEGARVETYSPYDPIGLPTALLPLLHLFDGRPVAEVLAQLDAEHGATLDPGYLRTLVDYGVLGAPEAS